MSAPTAARLYEHGAPLVVEPLDPLPDPGEGELRVTLQYGGVNPIDRYTALGRVAADGPTPRTLGGEAAGEIDGRAVLVTGAGLGARRDGVWAGVAVVPEAAVIPLPEGVGLREAAALGIAGLTAWNCVETVAEVEATDRVLVLGASGGVGGMIVSLAHARGAVVWGQTGSPAKVAHITRHGAERVLVADAGALGAAIAELRPTVVFDSLGGAFLAPMVEALAPRGRIISLGTSAGPEVSFNLQVLYRKAGRVLGYGGMQLREPERRAGLEAAFQALLRGDLRVEIDEVLPLSDVNEAFSRLEHRAVSGKLLLDLRPA